MTTDIQNLHDLTDEWSDAAVTYDAFKMNVTDTASDAGSRLLDLLVGEARKLSIDKSGNVYAAGSVDIGNRITFHDNKAMEGESDGSELHLGEGYDNIICRGNTLGVNVPSPYSLDGTLHVWSATAGSVTADVAVNDIVCENDDDGGISILTPDDANGSICFGSPSDNTAASMSWEFDDRFLEIGTNTASGKIKFLTGAGTMAMTILDDQRVGINNLYPASALDVTGDIRLNQRVLFHGIRAMEGNNTATFLQLGEGYEKVLVDKSSLGVNVPYPFNLDGTLHVLTESAGSVTADGTANEIVCENDDDGGLSILTPDDKYGAVMFGSPSGNASAIMRWKYDDLQMDIGTSTTDGTISFLVGDETEAMSIASNGYVEIETRLGIGTSPSELFHVYSPSSDKVAKFQSNDNRCAIQIGDNDTNGYIGAEEGFLWLGVNYALDTDVVAINSLGHLGIGTDESCAAACHVKQLGDSAELPVLILDQADDSEAMIEFTGVVGVDGPISPKAFLSLTTTHFIRATITGVGTVYIPVGTIA